MRTALPVAFVLAMFIGLAAPPAKADALNAAFPAPHWRKQMSPEGFGFDCTSKNCGRPAHVAVIFGPPSPAMADKIKTGLINRDWAEKLAASYRKTQGDQVTLIDFAVQTGQVPGWSMVYECNCDGSTSFISSRTMAKGKNTLTFFSMARSAETAQDNMNKMIVAALGESGL